VRVSTTLIRCSVRAITEGRDKIVTIGTRCFDFEPLKPQGEEHPSPGQNQSSVLFDSLSTVKGRFDTETSSYLENFGIEILRVHGHEPGDHPRPVTLAHRTRAAGDGKALAKGAHHVYVWINVNLYVGWIGLKPPNKDGRIVRAQSSLWSSP